MGIKITNDKRNEHISDADNTDEINKLKNKLNRIKKETEERIKNVEENYKNKINSLSKEYESDKNKIINSNTEKKSILLREYSDELMKFQNEYTKFKNEIEELGRKNKKLSQEHEDRKKIDWKMK